MVTLASVAAMNKAQYLQEPEAHDWTYTYASGAAYFKGEANQCRLDEIAQQDSELAALRDAYAAYIWEETPEPTLEDEKPELQQRYNLQGILWDAWKIGRKAAHRFGGTAVEYIAGAMRQAWAKAKAKVLNKGTPSDKAKSVYFICIDEITGSNTRLINQPLVDEVFTDREAADAALQILSRAFNRAFIRTSLYYRLH